MCHQSLQSYFTLLHSLSYHHKYTLGDLEAMMPWELNVYVALIQKDLQKMEEAQSAPKQQIPQSPFPGGLSPFSF